MFTEVMEILEDSFRIRNTKKVSSTFGGDIEFVMQRYKR